MNRRANKGFTLAELLIVVAIVLILIAVSFVAVQNHQRSMTQLEYDTIAKEIFIAAQNHLTAAKSQGYLTAVTVAEYGYPPVTQDDVEDKDYHIIVNNGSAGTYQKMLDMMLPFGSIDGTIFYNGSFIIRYQPSSARVLDVFYSDPKHTTFLTIKGTELGEADYEVLMDGYRGEDKKQARRNYNRAVVGWYGGEEGLPKSEQPLNSPEIIIHNEDRLWVEIKDKNNKKGSLQLVVSGSSSGAQITFVVLQNRSPHDDDRVKWNGDTCSVVLDDITTSGLHFADINTIFADNYHRKNGKLFIPGEDLTIEAVAYDNTTLSNIAYSGKKTTNSLFADIADADKDGVFDTASVAYIRHLENLDAGISNLGENDTGSKLNIDAANQLVDLKWDTFVSATSAATNGVYYTNSGSVTNTKPGTFMPVSPAAALSYDGKNHSITGVTVSLTDGKKNTLGTGDAGLFGTSTYITEIKNLELLDFNVTGTSAAGALAGSLTGTKVENVLARNSTNSADVNITASAGSAGGLIGSANNCTVSKSAAALIVNGSTNAGGLIGTASGGSVTASYAGGHTEDGSYQKWIDGGKPYDVTGANAGGLIGRAANVGITNSYSTCSAQATGTSGIAGGLIGSAGDVVSVTHCYATGKVDGATKKAFVGSGTPAISTASNNESYYFSIVNGEDVEPGSANVQALDASAASYNGFVGAPDDTPPNGWTTAEPYDEALKKYYGEARYNLKSVERLGSTLNEDDYVKVHYGDWPAPELFVLNEKN